MTDEKNSILLSDISIEGDLIEKDKIILDAKINGDIKADEIITHQNSNISGNIEGVLNQKTLMIEEGAVLKIKTETHK